jgi:hypothetical protein
MCDIFAEESVRGAWKALRTQFTREVKKVRKPRSGEGGGEPRYSGKWMFYQSLLFLKDTVEAKKTDGGNLIITQADDANLTQADDGHEHSDGECSTIDDIIVVEEAMDDNFTSPTPSSSSSTPKLTARERAIMLEEKKIKIMEERQEMKRKESTEDADLSFLKSMLPDLKKARNKGALKIKLLSTMVEFLENEDLLSSDH